jgi:[ribosomal protein S5]-alanine N-acetyltransferase
MIPTLTLVPIDRDGRPRALTSPLPELAEEVGCSTAALYATTGFREPWIGYLALVDGDVIGTCAFKHPPIDGRIEIAYFTFPEWESRGHASAMASQLVAMARAHDPAMAGVTAAGVTS